MKAYQPDDWSETDLHFGEDGVCRISMKGVPRPANIEGLIESYITQVELLPNPLRVISIDISGLEHMIAQTRRVFSELLTQASSHYEGKVQMVVAGGSLDLRRFIELLFKGIGASSRSHVFADTKQAKSWIHKYLLSA